MGFVGKSVGSTRPGVTAARLALRIAAWIAVAIVFHCGDKYGSDILTDHFQATAPSPDDGHRYGLRQPPTD